MQARFFPFLSVLILATGLWSVSFYLSQYLSLDLVRDELTKQSVFTKPNELRPEVENLRQQAKAELTNKELQLRAGAELRQEAARMGDSKLMMEAIDRFNAALAIDPNDELALLALGDACLEFGVSDKAMSYYERYLKLRPDNLEAQTSYALSLIQAKNTNQAAQLLQQVLTKDKSFLPALLALAVAEEQRGSLSRAQELLEQAKRQAQTDEERTRVSSVLQYVTARKSGAEENTNAALKVGELPETEPETEPKTEEVVSPAQRVEGYFRSHSIIGPKLKTVYWADASTAVVEVNDFPVSQMPEAARNIFTDRMKTVFRDITEKFQVVIRDATTREDLMKVDINSDR